MKRFKAFFVLFFAAAAMVLAAPASFAAKAKGAPDAWVKGLWLRPTGLPKDAAVEDLSKGYHGNPYFEYTFGKGTNGPAVIIDISRSPQSAAQENFLALDKRALKGHVDAMVLDDPKAYKLKFAASDKYSEKFSYPCQLVTYDNEVFSTDYSFMILFMQTDDSMFSVQIAWEKKNKKFKKADAEAILGGLEMVE